MGKPSDSRPEKPKADKPWFSENEEALGQPDPFPTSKTGFRLFAIFGALYAPLTILGIALARGIAQGDEDRKIKQEFGGTIICPKCGRENSSRTRVCPRCEHRLPA